MLNFKTSPKKLPAKLSNNKIVVDNKQEEKEISINSANKLSTEGKANEYKLKKIEKINIVQTKNTPLKKNIEESNMLAWSVNLNKLNFLLFKILH